MPTKKRFYGSKDSPFLTVDEAAKYLRLRSVTLKKMRTDGTGPVYRKHKGKVVYHMDELKEWSKNNAYNSTGGAET